MDVTGSDSGSAGSKVIIIECSGPAGCEEGTEVRVAVSSDDGRIEGVWEQVCCYFPCGILFKIA